MTTVTQKAPLAPFLHSQRGLPRSWVPSQAVAIPSPVSCTGHWGRVNHGVSLLQPLQSAGGAGAVAPSSKT